MTRIILSLIGLTFAAPALTTASTLHAHLAQWLVQV